MSATAGIDLFIALDPEPEARRMTGNEAAAAMGASRQRLDRRRCDREELEGMVIGVGTYGSYESHSFR